MERTHRYGMRRKGHLFLMRRLEELIVLFVCEDSSETNERELSVFCSVNGRLDAGKWRKCGRPLCAWNCLLFLKKSQSPHFVLHVYFHSFHAIFYYFTDEASSTFPFFQLPGVRWKLISFPFSLVFLPPFLPVLFFSFTYLLLPQYILHSFLSFSFIVSHSIPRPFIFVSSVIFFMSLANYFTPLYP
jgi:hypothetical protein